MVWVGGLDSWDPPYERDCCLGVPLESQTTNPNLPLVEIIKTNGSSNTRDDNNNNNHNNHNNQQQQ